MKLSILVPSTTRYRDWNDITQTYLYDIFCKSLLSNLPEHEITVYIGYDKDDHIYKKTNQINKFNEFIDNKIGIKWIKCDYPRGHVTKIWNRLCSESIKDGFEYMYVCGDDIQFPEDKKWLDIFIEKLQKNDNIGWSAPWSNNDELPTQFMIHKTHFDIFGFVYPEQIQNWFCDNFMNELYHKKYRNWCKEIHHLNLGGKPRYEPQPDKNLCNALLRRHGGKINKYVSKLKNK